MRFDRYLFPKVIRRSAWREQLLDRPVHKRNAESDVAEMVLAMDEGDLRDMLVFDGDGRGSAHCYLADAVSGVWRRTAGPEYHEAHKALSRFADEMDRTVVEAVKDLIRRQHAALRKAVAEGQATPTQLEQLQTDRMESEEHLREIVLLYERMKRVGFQRGLMTRLMTERLVATREEGVTEAKLDATRDCVAFEDGVYCFR